MQKTHCMTLVLLSKGKTPKLSFYKKETLLETIAFFSEQCFQKR